MLTKQRISQLQNMVAYGRSESAYKELFFHFYPLLYKFSFAICKNRELAEEIVMDVTLKMWRLEQKLAFVENLTTYLYTAINNTSINYLKREKRYSISHILEKEEDNQADPVLNTELKEIIESCVIKLPLQCQLVFRLIKEDGLTHKQVSEILGITQNTIESHMRNALRKLRHELGTYLNKKI